MIADIKWGTFLLWGLFDLIIAGGSFFFLRETRGLSLEQITHTATNDTSKPLRGDEDLDYESPRRPEVKGLDVEVE